MTNNNKQQALEELMAVMDKHQMTFTIDEGLYIASHDFSLGIDSAFIHASDIQSELNRMKNDE